MENSLLEILFTVHVITLCVLDISQNAKELSPNGDKIYVKYHLTVVSVFDATLIVVILMCGLSITILDKWDELSTQDTKSTFMQHESQTVILDILLTY